LWKRQERGVKGIIKVVDILVQKMSTGHEKDGFINMPFIPPIFFLFINNRNNIFCTRIYSDLFDLIGQFLDSIVDVSLLLHEFFYLLHGMDGSRMMAPAKSIADGRQGFIG